ncbi:laminin G sub domain 2 [Seminavis robusta]|uniref:Laminin G sub domain 2 n=1 Tax=Seminavis robusta TaxID=568900 RepID=A0A9N8EUY2_9STRA|nr:laminin G sub domain 2 [Seminavis robusta]|eukprot:Sro1643_g288120.1 laminin G sub domain 2 (1431) ;mRNA; f:10373-15744
MPASDDNTNGPTDSAISSDHPFDLSNASFRGSDVPFGNDVYGADTDADDTDKRSEKDKEEELDEVGLDLEDELNAWDKNSFDMEGEEDASLSTNAGREEAIREGLYGLIEDKIRNGIFQHILAALAAIWDFLVKKCRGGTSEDDAAGMAMDVVDAVNPINPNNLATSQFGQSGAGGGGGTGGAGGGAGGGASSAGASSASASAGGASGAGAAQATAVVGQMATQAAVSAAGASTAAASTAAAASATIATTVATAVASASVASQVGVTIGVAAVTVAAVSTGMGVAPTSNTTTAVVKLDAFVPPTCSLSAELKQGIVELKIQGMPEDALPEHKDSLEGIFRDLYNNITGMCLDPFSRVLHSAELQVLFEADSTDGPEQAARRGMMQVVFATTKAASPGGEGGDQQDAVVLSIGQDVIQPYVETVEENEGTIMTPFISDELSSLSQCVSADEDEELSTDNDDLCQQLQQLIAAEDNGDGAAIDPDVLVACLQTPTVPACQEVLATAIDSISSNEQPSTESVAAGTEENGTEEGGSQDGPPSTESVSGNTEGGDSSFDTDSGTAQGSDGEDVTDTAGRDEDTSGSNPVGIGVSGNNAAGTEEDSSQVGGSVEPPSSESVSGNTEGGDSSFETNSGTGQGVEDFSGAAGGDADTSGSSPMANNDIDASGTEGGSQVGGSETGNGDVSGSSPTENGHGDDTAAMSDVPARPTDGFSSPMDDNTVGNAPASSVLAPNEGISGMGQSPSGSEGNSPDGIQSSPQVPSSQAGAPGGQGEMGLSGTSGLGPPAITGLGDNSPVATASHLHAPNAPASHPQDEATNAMPVNPGEMLTQLSPVGTGPSGSSESKSSGTSGLDNAAAMIVTQPANGPLNSPPSNPTVSSANAGEVPAPSLLSMPTKIIQSSGISALPPSPSQIYRGTLSPESSTSLMSFSSNTGYIPAAPQASNPLFVPVPLASVTLSPASSASLNAFSNEVAKEPTRPPVQTFPTSKEPTLSPTSQPTKTPTPQPTFQPTDEPTLQPTDEPTTEPTTEPTIQPTIELTQETTVPNTISPTTAPSIDTLLSPSAIPNTLIPTVTPGSPSVTPTTGIPTVTPGSPSISPTTESPTSSCAEALQLVAPVRPITRRQLQSSDSSVVAFSAQTTQISSESLFTTLVEINKFIEGFNKDLQGNLAVATGVSDAEISTPIPTVTPGSLSVTPTKPPTEPPTASPTGVSTGSPTPTPTVTPGSPSVTPTKPQTEPPTASPTGVPTYSPTTTPTVTPGSPSVTPTTKPRTEPPTASPIGVPTGSPTTIPTVTPGSPSVTPTTKPRTEPPTASPTGVPTGSPTPIPTVTPGSPSVTPTKPPTEPPTMIPSNQPSVSPSHTCNDPYVSVESNYYVSFSGDVTTLTDEELASAFSSGQGNCLLEVFLLHLLLQLHSSLVSMWGCKVTQLLQQQ